MRTSWWRSKNELDADQIAFIQLPPHGRYALIGPPGSGKTNLLLLRAQYIAGTGEKNVLVITYTNALADFIRTGISSSGLIATNQIKTYHSWAASHILENLGQRAIPKGEDFDEGTRRAITGLLQETNNALQSKRLYSAIFVDEAQDFTAEELAALLSLSDNVCICGDENQGIYRRDGLAAVKNLALAPYELKRHFRIGQRIARVADRLIPPEEGKASLEETSNYNPKTQGESSAVMHPCSSRDEQFSRMLELIQVQLDAFKGDSIGIICGTRESVTELRARFNETELHGITIAHGVEKDASFSSEKRIHIMTIHAAKGTEFRAVHIYGAEELANHPLNRRRLGYTAITRAKTALNVFRTGATNNPLENAFAEPSHVEIDELFD
ncbi:putative DNA / RNA helicase [Thiomonas arsenitoxydans]|uniref:DNA / RNA helicase n=1 Tax=Thiomonas arsenitoxydans (strain DSM 22701 / CIP 110005 / 3As) TaxID=426114 RepID=D6CND9_THIA3|nr:UvrD-helicase domain-containing protein [Thiomonas arsenitoxydans]CAZ90067.1 putative DNA / RNA helicase [Thiomonas arsenitoxydans]CQR37108.1 putative DNA / RNA helicase [Thiomonas arsenitoxydans]CQR38227.1 putative DNA / RNA helicase [Thiomonas arsenitoxydans]CQR40381.1 putative DNA / RNA helicase [Thiomonas arsenitoxydans]CQR40448.1 putative DNA / RNA helicase [Thiomonas arsenitoxydans]